jgi:DNA-binding CsgD family transcriptional regulator
VFGAAYGYALEPSFVHAELADRAPHSQSPTRRSLRSGELIGRVEGISAGDAGWVDRKGSGWWAGCVAGSVGFVGRERELSRLEGALEGDARLLLVTGDAGVGKTRFVGEGLRRAAAGALVCISGGCLPLAGELPLLPVADALGELSRLDRGRLLETALGIAPLYVRAEVERLLPQLGNGEPGTAGRDDAGQRERLLSAVAKLLSAVAGRSGLVVAIEDVHWADSATLDCLTYLARAGRREALTVVVTCRSDEAPLDERTAAWLAHVRAGGEVEEIRLRPMSRGEVAEQIAGLTGEEPSGSLVDDVYARAEGNPFFTEQLVAAAMTEATGGALRPPKGLPDRLAELLAERTGRCGGDAQAVLAGLAVAGRPLTEGLLCQVTELDRGSVRAALRELAAAQLLAAGATGGEYRPRHALLAEAVAAGLLPGERVTLHERTALALAAVGDETLAAEVAGHWAAAGRGTEELPARVAAAEAAERVFGYAEAAAHWQRAIELCQAVPAAAGVAGVDVPRMYVRAIDALEMSGDGGHAGSMAEEAYRRFADHRDPPTAAVICHRAARFRAIEDPAAGLPLIKESLRLFEQTPPTADNAMAWCDYATNFLFHAQGRQEASLTALNRAREIAEAAGATSLTVRILSWLALHAFLRGQLDEGFDLVRRGRMLAGQSADGAAGLVVAICESDAMLTMGRFRDSAEVGLRGFRAAEQAGLSASFQATIVASNAAEALLASGHTSDGAAVIDPLTTGPPDFNDWLLHRYRAEIDMLRGGIEAATRRQQQINACIGRLGNIEFDRDAAQWAAELALWAGRPGDALVETRRALPRFEATDLTIFCGKLLATGMRACADLAETARARQDQAGVAAALAAADGLVSWVEQVADAPFTDHPFIATIPAYRASWDAERTRLAGASDPAAWAAATKSWDGLGCPHRAAYAWWRQAQAQLDAGLPATAAVGVLQAAAAAAGGHAPLLAQIRALAQRARIPLDSPPDAVTPAPPNALARYGLTGRELAVLRLVAAGRTNAQIGAELFISPRTAGVHVTNMLRKLGVANRVQAAALAERAGLAHTGPV